MKKAILFIGLFCSSVPALSQDAPPEKKWEFNANLNLYFFEDEFIPLPIVTADRNKLHLEGRYNYEDLRTSSLWVGYNLSGGTKWEYTITPMVGGVVGNTRGIAAGLEIDLTVSRFNFYTEMEYLFDSGTSENNFYYDWTDITYSVNDWLSAGLSAQRTKLYKTKVDLQRGVLVSATLGSFLISTYIYNIDVEEPFVLLTLGATF